MPDINYRRLYYFLVVLRVSSFDYVFRDGKCTAVFLCINAKHIINMEEFQFIPPVSQDAALVMIDPLDPRAGNNSTEKEKEIAFQRLTEFIKALLPE